MLTEWLAFDFVRYALAAMALLAAVYPLLGVFVVGQRVAYFSDAVAHSAFIGAAIAGLLGWRLGDALLVTAPLFAAYDCVVPGAHAPTDRHTAGGGDHGRLWAGDCAD
jgi:ABC-type Mn2+/Zn2+ transport system permease subunit